MESTSVQVTSSECGNTTVPMSLSKIFANSTYTKGPLNLGDQKIRWKWEDVTSLVTKRNGMRQIGLFKIEIYTEDPVTHEIIFSRIARQGDLILVDIDLNKGSVVMRINTFVETDNHRCNLLCGLVKPATLPGSTIDETHPDFRFKPAIEAVYDIAPSHVVDIKGSYLDVDMDLWGIDEGSGDLMTCYFKDIGKPNYVAAEMQLAERPFAERNLDLANENEFKEKKKNGTRTPTRAAKASPVKDGEPEVEKAAAGRRSIFTSAQDAIAAQFLNDFDSMRKTFIDPETGYFDIKVKVASGKPHWAQQLQNNYDKLDANFKALKKINRELKSQVASAPGEQELEAAQAADAYAAAIAAKEQGVRGTAAQFRLLQQKTDQLEASCDRWKKQAKEYYNELMTMHKQFMGLQLEYTKVKAELDVTNKFTATSTVSGARKRSKPDNIPSSAKLARRPASEAIVSQNATQVFIDPDESDNV